MQPKSTSNNIKEHKVMNPPTSSPQPPKSLRGGAGRMCYSSPPSCLFRGWGKAAALCELFSDTAASEFTVRHISGHHNSRSRRREKKEG